MQTKADASEKDVTSRNQTHALKKRIGMPLRCNWCRNLDTVKLHTAGVGKYFCCSGATLRRPHIAEVRAFLWEQKQVSVYSLSTNIYYKLEKLSDLKIYLNASAGYWKRCVGTHSTRGPLFAHPWHTALNIPHPIHTAHS